MIRVFTVCLILVLSACAVWPAGEDPNGRALKKKANTVLQAANSFVGSHGRNPESLQALVPEFIKALPSEPQLSYDAKKVQLHFSYSPTLATGQCISAATVGASSFNCQVCYM